MPVNAQTNSLRYKYGKITCPLCTGAVRKPRLPGGESVYLFLIHHNYSETGADSGSESDSKSETGLRFNPFA